MQTNVVSIPTGTMAVNTYFVPLAEQGDPLPVIVVDPGDDGEKIVKELAKRRMRVVAAALTHRHFDHVLGLAALCEAFPGIHIGIHPLDKNGLGPSTSSIYLAEMRRWGLASTSLAMLSLPSPDVMLTEGTTLDCLIPTEAGELRDAAKQWVTLHTPGHTAGSVCFSNAGEYLLLSGDTLFRGSWGRTDLADGSEEQMRQSLDRLFALPDRTTVYTGHEAYGFTLATVKY
jgi:glyoxylase-like metal-dependent hydrolase (beta-lactamase superfamily II)